MASHGHCWIRGRLGASLILGLAMAFYGAGSAAAADDVPWDRVAAGNHVILLRHALAPGTGDPPDFELGDCSTQRNINRAGRRQADRIGERLRQAGLSDAPVFTSEWCRCRETATELALGEPQPLKALNSFYGRRDQREERISALRAFLAEREGARTAVLVTHQVTITAATDVYPASGEAVIARIQTGGRVDVVATLTTPVPRR